MADLPDMTPDLDRLVPFNAGLRRRVQRLLPHAFIRRIPPGSYVFHAGDVDTLSHFLLSGQILLYRGPGTRPLPLRAIDQRAGFPIAPGTPRRFHALASTHVTILSVETTRMYQLLGDKAFDRSPAIPYEVTHWGTQPGQTKKPEVANDWIRTLPKPLVEALPNTLRTLLADRLVHQEVTAGSEIVTEDQQGSHFFHIARGRCRVTRNSGRRHRHQSIIAICRQGQSFGARALIEDTLYRHTVTALEDTSLLRLDKTAFLSLLVRPFLYWQSLPEALEASEHDKGVLLDVRSARIYQQRHIPQSINLPLSLLSQAAPLLDPSYHYTICSESLRRGMTAAFLLAEQGIRAAILEGGIRQHIG